MKKHVFENGILVQGDCLEALKTLDENSVDSVVTDPPYGLGKEPDIAQLMKSWIYESSDNQIKSGFMNQKWDTIPGPEYWKEVYRVLKPGGHILVFSSTRTWDLLSIAIRFAGFQNRDTIRREYVEGEPEAIDTDGEPIDITALSWCYGSGFPKSLSVSKAIDSHLGAKREIIGKKIYADGSKVRKTQKLGGNATFSDPVSRESNLYNTKPTTEGAKRFDGFGTALKPAHEVILVFRKPLEGTVADNVLKHGTGGLNIDGCRISTEENLNGGAGDYQQPPGRWPANLILSHHPDCRPLGVKKIKNNSGSVTGNEPSSPNKNTYGKYDRKEWEAHGNNGIETVENWDCVDGCPIKEMNHQSGNRPGCTSPSDAKPESKYRPGQGNYQPQGPIYGDKGGASRFFLNTPTFRYQAKASRSERELGCDNLEYHSAGEVTGGRKEGSAGLDNPRAGAGRVSGAKNIHPTVKPLDIMKWIVRLVTPPDGTVLDPFVGSGSTAMAAILEGFKYIGIEKSEEYFPITLARIQYIEDGGLVEIKSKKLSKKPSTKKEEKGLNFYNL